MTRANTIRIPSIAGRSMPERILTVRLPTLLGAAQRVKVADSQVKLTADSSTHFAMKRRDTN
jgi:hypothetical protein